MELKTIISNIKSMRVQGAENVALSAVDALEIVSSGSRAASVKAFYAELFNAKKRLIAARPTEPCLANALGFVLHNLNITSVKHMKSHIELRIHKAREHFSESEKAIAEYGARKIGNKMVVFTHCHSSTVMGILLAAQKQGKSVSVHNTETRPLLQGRKTAIELAKAGIPVKHFVDNAQRLALKGVDMVLLGADAVTAEGRVINKIGSELVAEIAHNFGIPVYICTDSWKFDPHTVFGFDEPIENRGRDEVWKGAPKAITIMNPAFEIVKPELVTGIISELGVYRPETFIEEVKRAYPQIIKN